MKRYLQKMDTQELRNLQEAYLEVYPELNEAINHKGEFIRDPNSNYTRDDTLRLPSGKSSPEAIRALELGREAHRRQREKEKNKTSEQKEAERIERMRKAREILNPQKEQVDLYDIILSHLLDEGYAETYEAAEKIMVNMSEEWVDDILEANRGDQYATRGMDPQQAIRTKNARRDYRNTSGGHLYTKAATDERTTRHRGVGHAVPGYQGRGQTSRPTPRNTQTNAQMMRTSPDNSMAKDYVRKQLAAQRSARKYIEKARNGG